MVAVKAWQVWLASSAEMYDISTLAFKTHQSVKTRGFLLQDIPESRFRKHNSCAEIVCDTNAMATVFNATSKSCRLHTDGMPVTYLTHRRIFTLDLGLRPNLVLVIAAAVHIALCLASTLPRPHHQLYTCVYVLCNKITTWAIDQPMRFMHGIKVCHNKTRN